MPEIFAASSSANPRVTPRLIAVDMDGTFLTDAKTFDTDRFERILPRLQAHGIYFVVASGNTYTKLTDYMKGFENRGIIYIAENGAYLADDSGELAIHPFKEADVPHVYEVLDTLPQIGVILCTTEGIFIPHNRQGAVTSIVQDYFAAQGSTRVLSASPTTLKCVGNLLKSRCRLFGLIPTVCLRLFSVSCRLRLSLWPVALAPLI